MKESGGPCARTQSQRGLANVRSGDRGGGGKGLLRLEWGRIRLQRCIVTLNGQYFQEG